MKISQYKTLYKELESHTGFDFPEFREFFENADSKERDFEVGNYRFINEDYIDRIQCEELERDTYILGCFNASFLSSYIGLSIEIIGVLKDGENYEALGQYIIDNDYVSDIQVGYASEDGYGHHFSHYDHSEETIEIEDSMGSINTYYIFRVN